MTSVMYFLGLLLALLIAVLGELVSDEIRARLDRLPLALLSAAAKRLSPEQRAEMYERAWLPELHHILRGDQATPITRLIHGMRYAVRLWLAAPQIMRELEPDQAPTALSKRVLQFVFAPSYVVVYRMTGLPLAGATTAYVIHHLSWICCLVAALSVVAASEFTIFGRRRLIRAAAGHLPSREMFCGCWMSTMCRSLAILTNVVGTSIVTILAFRLISISTCSFIEWLVGISCVFVPLWMERRGFVLRPTPSDASGEGAQAPG